MRPAMEITQEQKDWMLQATKDFKVAMQIRNSMSARVAKRVTAILRIGVVSLGTTTVILMLMMYAFTSKMSGMIDALQTMTVQFSSMTQDMRTMRGSLTGMEQNISHVPAITQATVDISGTVGDMRTEVDSMRKSITDMNSEIHGITGHVNMMTWQIQSLDPAVQHMGRDVNRMSGPMRMFNTFNPMD